MVMMIKRLAAALMLCAAPIFATAQTQELSLTPITAETGQTVTLDASRALGGATGLVDVAWTWLDRPAASVATFSDPQALRPQVLVDVPGTYLARVELTDQTTGASAGTATVAFGTDNLPPVARIAGRSFADPDGRLILDGTDSYDIDGDRLQYAWSAVETPDAGTVTFADPASPLTDVELAGEGAFRLGLTVTDTAGNASTTATYEVVLSAATALDPARCRVAFDQVLTRPADERTVYDLGDVSNGPAIEYEIPLFDVDRGNEHTFDRLDFVFAGQSYSLSSKWDFLHFTRFIEHDGDRDTDALINQNAHVKDLTFSFGAGRGGVTLRDVVGRDLSRQALRSRSVDYCGVVDTFPREIDRTLPNDGSARVTFDLGNVQTAPFEDLEITDFDVNSGREHSFDTLWFEFNGRGFDLSTRRQFLHFVHYIEHDGDSETDALISPNPHVKDLTFTFGEGRGSITLRNVIGRGLSRSQLLRKSADFYEGEAAPVVESGRQIAPVGHVVFDERLAQIGAGVALDARRSSDLDGDGLQADYVLAHAPDGSSAAVVPGADGIGRLTPDVAGDYLVAAQVTDGQGGDTRPTLIRVGTGVRPVAQIDTDEVVTVGGVLSLDGSQSYDLDGDLLSYDWALLHAPAGSAAAITVSEGGPFASLSVDAAGTYVVQLQVEDSDAASLPVTRVIRVDPALPFADAGPDLVASASGIAQLDGFASRPVDADVAWSVLGLSDVGASAVLGDAAAITTGLTLPERMDGSRAPSAVQLVVGDADGISRPGTVVVEADNARPRLVSAARLSTTVGAPLTLNGADYAIDLNGDPLDFAWSILFRPEGSAATAGAAGAARLEADSFAFAPDRVGLYLIQIEAFDGQVAAVPAVLAVEVVNSAPVAVASGPASVFVGEVAALDGSASFDADGDALTFNWVITDRPAGSTANIPDPFGAVATFVPDVRGAYAFALSVSDGLAQSAPATLALDVPNRAPVAVLDGPDEAVEGVAFALSAAASSDPDGDALTFGFAVQSAPTGSSAVIEAGATPRDATFTPDRAGDYVFALSVDDGDVQTTVTRAVTVLSSNTAPILALLEPEYTVEVGLTLRLQLDAMDPNGTPISYFVQPLPLPAGMSLDASTGMLTFEPVAGQEQTYALTLGVTDGVLTDTAEVAITVLPADAGQTSIAGRVLDAQDFAQGTETPVVGATVALTSAALSTVTDADGRFEIGGLAGGTDVVVVTPNNGANPVAYSTESRAVRIEDNQARDLPKAILLTRLDDGCAPVVAGVATVLTGAQSGVTVEVPADSVTDFGGAPYAGDICLGSLPQLFEHPGFNDGVEACQIYALDAPGALFTQPIAISAPNVDALPGGAEAILWQLKSGFARFTPTARGDVVDGGTRLSAPDVPLGDGSALFAFLPQSPRLSVSADQPSGMRSLNMFDGNLQSTFDLVDYQAFDQAQSMVLSYNSANADPSVIVAGDVTIAQTAGLPERIDSVVGLGGLTVTDVPAWNPRLAANGDTPAVVGEAVSLRQSARIDTSGLDQGRYSYSLQSRARYACSKVVATTQGETILQARTQSEFGTGWAVDGLQRLIQQDDGSITILDDDTATSFAPENDFTTFDDEAIVIPAEYPISLAVDDFDNDGALDVTVAESGPGDITIIRNFDDRAFDVLRSFDVVGPRRPDGSSDPDPKPDITSLVSIDFNGDGLVDIPFAAQLDTQIGVLDGDGTANFQQRQLFVPQEARYLTVADLDEDGFEDIIYGATTGFFVQRPEFRAFFGGPDGFQDISLGGPSEGGIQRWVAPLQLVPDDIDGDGRIDIAMRTERGIHFAFGAGGRDFDIVTTNLANNGYFLLGEKLGLSDVDGDGLKEVFTTLRSGFVYYPNIDGRSFGAPVTIPLPPGTIDGGEFFLRDVNGDGREDILHSSVELNLYRSLGSGAFAPIERAEIDHPISGNFVVRDMDGDGALDLVSMQPGADGSVTIDFSRPSVDGPLVATDGEFSELTALPGGGWERRYKDGTVVLFDANGLQLSEADPRGNARSFTYDDQGRLTSITDQNGGTMTMAYTAEGRVESITYPDGRQTVLTFDSAGALERAAYPDGTAMRYRYDDEGRMVAVTDERGNETTHSYAPGGSYAGTIYPDGSSIANQAAASLGLDGLGGGDPLAYVAPEDRLAVHIDEKGNSSTVRVNEFGAIIETVDPLSRVTTFTRNADNLVVAVERPSDSDPLEGQQAALPSSWLFGAAHAQSGAVATPGAFRLRDEMFYDDRGNLVRQVNAINSTIARERRWTYEPEFSRVTEFVDYDGVTTTYTYNAFGEMTAMTDPEGGVMVYEYNLLGLKSAEVDKRGNRTEYLYNAENNVAEMILPDLSRVTMTYDDSGNVLTRTEAVGLPEQRTVVRDYDGRDRVISEETLDGTGTSIDGKMFSEYDDFGNLVAMVDETGLRTEFVYDDKNRQVQASVPGYGTTTYGYNDADELISEIDAEGHEEIWEFDAVGRITFTRDAVGNTATYQYDVRDNVARVTDGRNNITQFTYDVFDRPRTRTNPIAQTIAMAFDQRDNLIRITREEGSVETATYDGLSRRTEVVTPDNTYTYAYDPENNLVEAVDNDSRVSMTYDSRNRLETVTTDGTVGPQPAITLTYAYNARNERQTLADSLGGTWAYGFDERSRVETLTAPWGGAHSMDYDPAGRRTVLANATGRNTQAAYAEDRLSMLEHFQDSVAIARSGHAYLDDGQISLNEDLIAPALSTTFSYDDSDRLTMVSEGIPTGQGGTPLPVEDYAYDAQGNRTASHLSAAYVVDDHNRMLEDDLYTYGYDEKGNRITRTDKGTGVVRSYAYDSINQLIAVADDGVAVAAYAYDALGRRIAKTVGGVTEAYVYDVGTVDDIVGHDRLLDFEDGVLRKRWLHGQYLDEPVGYEEYATDSTVGAGTVFDLHADRQGSIIAVTNQTTGALAARYRYDAFGQREVVFEDTVQDRGFTGRELDGETGLYYYRARHYDPALGRFLQSDPLGFAAGDLNLYAYTWNDPQNWTDPSGLSPTAEKTTLTAGAAGLAVRSVATVRKGAVCLSRKVGTALAAVGKELLKGKQVGQGNFFPAGKCKTGFRAPKCKCPGGGGPGAGGLASFVAGTEVLTPQGRVAIETLREGDLVVARNEETGQTGVFPITALMSRTSPGALWLTLENAQGETSKLGVTSEHPLFVSGEGWVTAGKVSPGDSIRDANLEPLTVVAVRVHSAPHKVHNLEVADAHTYFAGDLEAWGHNASWSKHRKRIYDECGGVCAYCGIKTVFKGPRTGPRKDRFSLDHIIPRKYGGSDDPSNLKGCCVSCNSKRGAPKP
ncbi:RHS repeat-associated core domain-containing protein [Tateyamaria sp. SN3-11]|uniref:RHS repeat-associated core domain-containing protein n=1 Tax=Tateyamaria sp. SN3-11 TaxID=3092147 RepID=UPI0039EAED07